MKYILQGADIVKIYKILQNKMVQTCRKIENQIIPKQIAATTIEGTRKRGRPCKRLKNEVEEDLNIMGIKNGRGAARGRRKWRKIVQARVHNGL
jgi:hypothetical protein